MNEDVLDNSNLLVEGLDVLCGIVKKFPQHTSVARECLLLRIDAEQQCCTISRCCENEEKYLSIVREVPYR